MSLGSSLFFGKAISPPRASVSVCNMGIIASLECVPTVVLIVFRPYLTCLSHLHWEVGLFIMPISRRGVRIVPPPSRRAACSVPQGVSEGPCSAPTPQLLAPSGREDEGDSACRLSPGQAHGRRPEWGM